MTTTAQDRRHAVAFIAASLALLAVVLGLLGARRFAVRERAYVVVFHESVAGLEPASLVSYKGVPVGVVRAIRLRAGTVDEVEVELGIRVAVPIKADVRAQLRPQGITGLYQLELVGGTLAAPDLPEGGEIRAEPSILSTLESALRDLADMARGVRGSGDDVEAALADLRDAFAAVRDAARSLEGTAAAIATDVHAGVATLRATAEPIQAVAGDEAWRTLGPELLAALQDLRRATASIERAAGALARLEEDNRGDVRAVVQDLRRASGDLREVVRRVRASPASLVIEHPAVEKPFPDPLPQAEERP